MAMIKKTRYFLGIIFLSLTLVHCAKRGSPKGGPEDKLPPEVVSTNPPNFSTNFKGKNITITFNELVKLNKLQQQLIISPPMEPAPLITPIGGAANSVKIEILDTLIPNTTYLINFGNSIVDNNESNAFPYYTYVMSTGPSIDSLKLRGTINDALMPELEGNVTVMLYPADTIYSDSLVYQDIPRYVTSTKDSSVIFELTNLRAGDYKLVALLDEDKNYTFQADKDKIAFYEDFISIPAEEDYALTLFSEEPLSEIGRPRQGASQRVNFPFYGSKSNMDVRLLSTKPEGFESLITTRQQGDSLLYWYKPFIENDSLVFETRLGNALDTLFVRRRGLKKDSLEVISTGSTLLIGDTLRLQSTIPVVAMDEEKITIMSKDSTVIDFESYLRPKQQEILLLFETLEDERYQIDVLPEALTDFYGTQTDSLSFKATTKKTSDYGELELTLRNARNPPYIVQLVNSSKFEVQREIFGTEDQDVYTFKYLTPGKYYLRLIADENGNKKYDSGNFLLRRQPEPVIYFPVELDVRANFSNRQIFTLDEKINTSAGTDPGLPEN
ncbi:MAG: Ig-like domain-containing protein [Leeuwenhoekiella sp.]